MTKNFLNANGTTSSSFKVGPKGVTLISKVSEYAGIKRRYLVTDEVDTDGNALTFLYVDEAEAKFHDIETGKTLVGIANRLSSQLSISSDGENQGWYKVASIGVDGILSQAEETSGAYSLLLQVNGIDGPGEDSDYAYSGMLEIDFKVVDGKIDDSDEAFVTPKVISGNLEQNYIGVIVNSDANALELYWYLQKVDSKYSVTVLAENFGIAFVDTFRHTFTDSNGDYESGYNVSFASDLDESSLKLAILDISVDASSIYFNKDITITEDFGQYKISKSGNTTINTLTDDMTLVDFIEGALKKEFNPSEQENYILPSCSITLKNTGYYEVGTAFSPEYICTFDEGNYPWDDTTGITISSYTISDSKSNTIQTGTSDDYPTVETISSTSVTLEDDEEYSLSLSLQYSDGDIPHTNLGDEYSDDQIKQETLQETTESAIACRFMFYGTMTEKVNELTSEHIRALSSERAIETSDLSFTVDVGAMRTIIAVPSTYKVSKVLNRSGALIFQEASNSFKTTTVDVEGANNYTAMTYNVYYIDYADALTQENKYTVTIESA